MVLIRRNGDWAPASLQNFDSEAELQRLLADSPDLIPGGTGTAVVREFRIPGVGAVDLVCVDETGVVTLVECKLAKNAEIRRAVVGQIFAYASGLQGMSYQDFDRIFSARSAQPLTAAVQASASAGFDADRCQAGIAAALASGRFRLVIAVDAITAQLKAVIEYLNEHLSDTVALIALELGYLKLGEVEILVPATYGAEIADAKEAAAHSAQRYTEEAVAEALESVRDEPGRALALRLQDHARRHAAKFKGGTGAVPSGGYYYTVAGKRRSLWSLYVRPEGPTIAVNLGAAAGASEDLALQMVRLLRQSPAINEKLPASDDEAIRKYPELPAALVGDGAETALMQALDLAIHDVHGPRTDSTPGSTGGLE